MKKRARKSFTLIEVVITMAILVVVGGMCGVQIKRLVNEQRFNVQTKHLTRMIRSAHRLSDMLEQDLSMQLDVDAKGLHVHVVGSSSAMQSLIPQSKAYTQIKSLHANGEEVRSCELTFLPRSSQQMSTQIEFASDVSNKKKKRKTLTSKEFFIRNVKKILTS